jgi:hypothetical protein
MVFHDRWGYFWDWDSAERRDSLITPMTFLTFMNTWQLSKMYHEKLREYLFLSHCWYSVPRILP